MADRREFPERIKAEIRERSGGKCECYRMGPDIIHLFPQPCNREAREVDHLFADILELEKDAPLTAEDGAHLSTVCHKIKTATDQKYRARRNKHTPRKDRPKSGWWHSGAKLQGRGFDKQFKRTIPSKNKPSVTVRRDA